MDERKYILIAVREDATAVRRLMYIQAPTLKEAWRMAGKTPMLKGWKIRNIQPSTYGRYNGWYTIRR